MTIKGYTKPEGNPVLSMGFFGAARYWKDRAHKAEDEIERLKEELATLTHQLKQAKVAAERAREDAETRCGEPGGDEPPTRDA